MDMVTLYNKDTNNILSPRDSGEYIVKNAQHIKINSSGLESLTDKVLHNLLNENINVKNFSQHELHPKERDQNAIEWIFVVDTLNFCFWTPKDHTKYKVNGYTGYFALCAAINRAIKDGLDITNAEFYSKIDFKTIANIFRSDNVNDDDDHIQIPLLKERQRCLHEVGQILLEKWHGKFENILQSANKSAIKLLACIVEEFPCFRDEAMYAGQRVSFYKRAQILISDIWSHFHGENFGEFHDIDRITMFADYRVPQVLTHFKALEYSEKLMDLLKMEKIIQNGDAMEVEIRGASIYIVEYIKEKIWEILKVKHPKMPLACINSILIDQFLWDYRRQHAQQLEQIPFHKVLSIYY